MMTETNRIEFKRELTHITSAGRLPLGLTQEEFFGGVSSPRNKELMRVFRDVEMVEALGSGMLRISKAYDLHSIFTFTDNFIKTIVPFHTQRGIDEIDVLVNGTVNHSNLTERQRNIIELIGGGTVNDAVNGAVNTKNLIETLQLSRRTIQRELSKLSQMGIIQWVGAAKTGHWELCKEQ